MTIIKNPNKKLEKSKSTIYIHHYPFATIPAASHAKIIVVLWLWIIRVRYKWQQVILYLQGSEQDHIIAVSDSSKSRSGFYNQWVFLVNIINQPSGRRKVFISSSFHHYEWLSHAIWHFTNPMKYYKRRHIINYSSIFSKI